MEKEKVSYKIVGVRLKKTMVDELELLAKDQQRSVSQIMRFAIEQYLDKYFGEEK